MKQNCWEVKNCGREQGGVHSKELGVCPASAETKLDGMHHGKNAGRACWVVAGTYCSGKPQGTFARKHLKCETCNFYNQVKKEEVPSFSLAVQLLQKLKEAADCL
jgi:hypothetical protein